jgi:hypothetical protein
MSITQRAASRRGVAAAACLAVVAGLVGGLASPAGATDGAEYVSQSEYIWDVYGKFGSSAAGPVYNTGLKVLDVEGEETLAYCVDPFQPLRHDGYDLNEEDWETSGVENAETVTKILAHYFPLGSGPEGYELTGSDKEKAAATQAAIWHLIADFELYELDPTGVIKPDTEVIYANYRTILKAVEDGALPAPLSSVSLSIDSPTLDEEPLPGQLVGPYVVHTTASSVELTPADGLTVHNPDGTPFEGAAQDGDELWLKAAASGTLTLSATAAGVEGGVRYFHDPDKQDFSFAVVTPKEVSASVELTAGTPPTTPTTTTSTVPETTTTTVTPQTTVVDRTTTVPVVPQQSTGTGGGLPVTGAQTMLLVFVALVLLAAGIGFGVVSKRARGEA